MLWGRVFCAYDATLHQCQSAWIVPAFFLRDIVGEVYDLHRPSLGRWYFSTFLKRALLILRLKKRFKSYRCHPVFAVVGMDVWEWNWILLMHIIIECTYLWVKFYSKMASGTRCKKGTRGYFNKEHYIEEQNLLWLHKGDSDLFSKQKNEECCS